MAIRCTELQRVTENLSIRTTSWTRVCSPFFQVRAQDNKVDFGTRRSSTGAANTGYVIDNVTVERQ